MYYSTGQHPSEGQFGELVLARLTASSCFMKLPIVGLEPQERLERRSTRTARLNFVCRNLIAEMPTVRGIRSPIIRSSVREQA